MIDARPMIRECGSYGISSVACLGGVNNQTPLPCSTDGDAKRTNLQIDVVKASMWGGRLSKLCKVHLPLPMGSFAKLTRNIIGHHGNIGRGGAALLSGRHTTTDRDANISQPQDRHGGLVELTNGSSLLPMGP